MNKKIFMVDRIESNFVVLIDRKQDIILINTELFDDRPKEGDVVIKCNNSFKIDKEATKKRRNNINTLMKGMWKN